MRKVKEYVWAGIEIALRCGIVKASVIYIEKANIYRANTVAFAKIFSRWKLRKKIRFYLLAWRLENIERKGRNLFDTSPILFGFIYVVYYYLFYFNFLVNTNSIKVKILWIMHWNILTKGLI